MEQSKGKHPQKRDKVMKTLAVRLEDEQHARLAILSRLAERSVTDTIRAAIDEHLAKLAANPEISAKAQEFAAAIEREAAEQRSAVQALFGTDTSRPPRSTRAKS